MVTRKIILIFLALFINTSWAGSKENSRVEHATEVLQAIASIPE